MCIHADNYAQSVCQHRIQRVTFLFTVACCILHIAIRPTSQQPVRTSQYHYQPVAKLSLHIELPAEEPRWVSFLAVLDNSDCLFRCFSLCMEDRRRRRRRFRIDTEVRWVGAHPIFGPWSRRGLNPIKPVYDPDWPDGRLNLTASAFNQLGQYTSSPVVAAATATQNSPFSSLAVAVAIGSTHCAYPRRDGQAELAWVAGYVVR